MAASVIVIVPEFVPEFVSNIKSWAPLVVKVAFPAPDPNTVSPDRAFQYEIESTCQWLTDS